MNLVDQLQSNTSFSKLQPGLQLAVDSTSLGEFKICPRRYYYSIICGFAHESVHLTFGILLHSACELYDHARAKGQRHDDALHAALRFALRWTWNSELKRPWISEHKSKNRLGLIRALVWYLDQFAEDPLETIILANGKPAVELSFSFDSGYLAQSTGERFVLCGHLDRLAKLNDTPYVIDRKTTEHTIDASYFAKYTPDNQFSLYTLAGKVVYEQPVRGLIVDAIQVGVTFARAVRGPVPRDDAMLDEWHRDLGHWLGEMEACAVEGHWPLNDKACGLFGGCPYRGICSKSPSSREQWLRSEFPTRRQWDPLQRRGDI